MFTYVIRINVVFCFRLAAFLQQIFDPIKSI